MRILIISDNHGRLDNIKTVAAREDHIDRFIHCGDVEGTEWQIPDILGCQGDIVAGNNDYFSDLPGEKELMVDGRKALLTHGHSYYVYMDNKFLLREAVGRGMDMVFYGHTHMPRISLENGVYIVNPGSISYPRQEGKRPSYIIMETGGNEPVFTIKYLD